jgi:hypothetical protein
MAAMLSAEILKLRKRYGTFVWAALLAVGGPLVFFGAREIYHLVDPAKYGPAGGIYSLYNSLIILELMGGAAAVIVGATAASQDVSSGVFRELVITGRSRLTIFAARTLGCLVFFLPLVVLGTGLSVTGATVFAGNIQAPSPMMVVDGFGWTILVCGAQLVVAIGLASIVPSRVAIGLLLMWEFAVSQLLLQITQLGNVRDGVLFAAFDNIAPAKLGQKLVVYMSAGTATVVIVAWVVVFLAAGAWRTVTRDA